MVCIVSVGIITAGWRAGWPGLTWNLILTAGRPVTRRLRRKVKVTNMQHQRTHEDILIEENPHKGGSIIFVSALTPSLRGVLLWPHPCKGHQGGRAPLQVWCPICLCWGQRWRQYFHEEKRWQHIESHLHCSGGPEDQHKEGGQWRQRGHHSSLQVPWR